MTSWLFFSRRLGGLEHLARQPDLLRSDLEPGTVALHGQPAWKSVIGGVPMKPATKTLSGLS